MPRLDPFFLFRLTPYPVPVANWQRELELVGIAGETRLRLRVKPGSRRNKIVGPHGGALKLEVTAAAERGKANDAVLALIAAAVGLRGSEIRLVAGHGSRDKLLGIPLAPRELSDRLARGAVNRKR